MVDQVPDEAVQQALEDLQRYLSDELAPMMVADSVEELLDAPVTEVARTIERWMDAQYRGFGGQVPVSDCIYHALKKLHHLGDLELLDRERLGTLLNDVGHVLMDVCPPEEQETLLAHLSRLDSAEPALATPVSVMQRPDGQPSAAGPVLTGPVQVATASTAPAGRVRMTGPVAVMGGGAATATAAGPGEAVQLRRLALLLDRLEQGLRAGGHGAGEPAEREHGQLVTSYLSMAADKASSPREMNEQLEALGRLGFRDTQLMFRELGRRLPAWNIRLGGGGNPAVTSKPAQAMRKLVNMAESPQDAARRFHELMTAAIELFNAGGLVQAAAMFELAEQLATEKTLNPDLLKTIKERARQAISIERLARAAKHDEDHPLLRTVLGFFPQYGPEWMLTELREEPKRERRYLMLSLLRVHGDHARRHVFAELERCIKGEVPDLQGYFQRNLVFLLRRLPETDDAQAREREIDLLSRALRLENPVIVLKETIGALSQLPHPRAERALTALVGRLEAALVEGQKLPHSTEQLQNLLDRAVAALAAQPSPAAPRVIVNHALRTEKALGDAIARLDVLAKRNLAEDTELIGFLVNSLTGSLPNKLAVFVGQSREASIGHLIKALSGTPVPAVREALGRIAQKYAKQRFAEQASSALRSLDGEESTGALTEPQPTGPVPTRPQPQAQETMSGDVRVFGLPNLLQSLSSSEVSGTLTLTGASGETISTIDLHGGLITACRTGQLSGEVAVYQLLEKPVSVRFSLAKRPEGEQAEPPGPVMDAVGLLMEGVRRHDEYHLGRGVVPDDMRLQPTGTKPTRPADEENRELVRSAWQLAASGVPALECEARLPADGYTVRKLLVYWLENGALKPR
jgi:hypothetical protein